MTIPPDKAKAILDALDAGDTEAAKALFLEAALTGEGEPAEPADPAEGTPPTAAGEPAETSPADPLAPAASAADAPATAMLLRVTGARSLADAEPILRSAITAARTADADRTAVTMTARRGLIAELIQLGAETPATAWDGNAADLKPVARLTTESLESMRTRVASLKARGGTSSGHTPPPTGGGEGRTFNTSRGAITLTASEIKSCEDTGAKLEAYAENKAVREAARAPRRP